MPDRPILADSDEGSVYHVVGDRVRVLASGDDTNGAYEIFEMRGPRDSGPPPHSHPWNEAYVMLEGEMEVMLDGQKMRATPGCFINAPKGMLHAYRILSDEAKFIIVTSPAGAANFFAELDRETGGSRDDMEGIVRVAVRHGFNVPPPPAGD
jgi:quercetin dioxygenase-like cupin family protein